jgi:hypothetical protein
MARMSPLEEKMELMEKVMINEQRIKAIIKGATPVGMDSRIPDSNNLSRLLV